MTREEYLRRPLIEGAVFDITTEHVRVYDDCTLFLNVTQLPQDRTERGPAAICQTAEYR